MMLSHKYQNILLASLLLGSSVHSFAPHRASRAVETRNANKLSTTQNYFAPIIGSSTNPFAHQRRSFTSLQMANDDFNEGKYTESAWACVAALTKAADYYDSNNVDSAMLLDILLSPTKHNAGENAESAHSAVKKILLKADIDPVKLSKQLEIHMSKQPKLTGDASAQKVMTPSMVKVLEAARNAKMMLGDSFVSSEALLLALTREDQFTKDALSKLGKSYSDVLSAVQAEREKSGPATSRTAENMYDALDKYGIDFTAQAAEGKLDPVIGRDDEIRRAIQILSRRRKNNPVLIGDPGVGKTAIAEGIAQRMIAGDVPDSMKPPCKLIGLDLGALVAGATMRGEFEERLKSVLEEVQGSDGEIILFIDEMHTLVGAGAAQGSMDASNLLKPALARGKIRCIGATTVNEYRQFIEKDKALERRFQQVMVDQPSPEDAVSILRGLKPRYELHHGVRIRDEALLAAAKLSHRYIPDRYLPDKAIDLVDEACAKLKNELTSKPTILDEIDRKIIQLEMERLSLKSDAEDSNDAAVFDRIRNLDNEIDSLRIRSDELTMKWEAERGGVDRLQDLKEEIAAVQLDIEKAERDYNLNEAAELKFSVLPKLEEELATLEAAAEEADPDAANGEKMLRDEVTADDIANVIASWTGIPPQRMLESERDRILRMGEILGDRVVGQDEAIQVVTEAIQRSRAGLNDPTKPIASMVFLGPTGVGKTELCKALAQFMFDTEEAIIRIDMSEYMEKHTVSRLVGAPPGYVGYEEGGQLTDAVRRKPYSVVLFDEMEKAHPDVFNIMLQLLDDGHVTDSKGTNVNFCNTVVIFTSNVGSQDILELGGKSDPESQELMKEKVQMAMREKFKPEFLNRIDENVIFNSLGKDALRGIVKLEVDRLSKRLADRNISMTLSDSAYDYLTDIGFDPIYGARPLKRAIQRELETSTAQGILRGDFNDGDKIFVTAGDNGLNIDRIEDAETVHDEEEEEFDDTDIVDVQSEFAAETETIEANDDVEDSTKEEETEKIPENDEKSDPVEVKEVEAASESEVKKEADTSPVENEETEKDENKVDDTPSETTAVEKQVEEVIEHPTEAPHPQAPKSSVLEQTSVLYTRDAQDPQERSKEFLELRSYEAKRRSIYLSKMKSTALYWKAFHEMMSKSYEETDHAENLIRGNVVANEAYGNFLKCAAQNRLGYDGCTVDKCRGERLKEDRDKKYEELGFGVMLLGVRVNLERMESQWQIVIQATFNTIWRLDGMAHLERIV